MGLNVSPANWQKAVDRVLTTFKIQKKRSANPVQSIDLQCFKDTAKKNFLVKPPVLSIPNQARKVSLDSITLESNRSIAAVRVFFRWRNSLHRIQFKIITCISQELGCNRIKIMSIVVKSLNKFFQTSNFNWYWRTRNQFHGQEREIKQGDMQTTERLYDFSLVSQKPSI